MSQIQIFLNKIYKRKLLYCLKSFLWVVEIRISLYLGLLYIILKLCAASYHDVLFVGVNNLH